MDQVIDAFGLGRFRDHRTAELSTGTRRVVDLASIVLADPRLLLLDEPTAGIAQREAEAFIPLLRRIHEVADTTIVIVEHDVPLIFSLCSSVVVMELGRVAVAGSPEEVRADPKALMAYLGASDEALQASGPITGGRRRTGGKVRAKGNMDTSTLHVNPLAPLGRSWRRLRRRSLAMQVRTILLIVAVIVGLVLWIDLAPSERAGRSGRGGRIGGGHPADTGVAGEHHHARRDGHLHQRRLPDREPQHRRPGSSASRPTRSTASRRRRSSSS